MLNAEFYKDNVDNNLVISGAKRRRGDGVGWVIQFY